MSELVSDMPSSPDWELTISLNCFALMFSVRARYQTSPGSRSPERVLIGTPAAGVKPMLVSTGFALMHRRQARAIAEVGEDDPAVCRFRSGQAGQFVHQKRIRQTVKPIAPHPLRLVAARDRQQSRHARQVVVKSRVETRYLRQVGKSAVKRLGQQDLLRQMLRIEWAEPVQLLNHFRRDSLRLAILRPAMHHAMSHRGQCITPDAFLDPIHQSAHRHRVIRRRY